MLEIYLKEKDKEGIIRFKKYLHINDLAKILKIQPATLLAYISRDQISIKKKKIKNLTFISADDVDMENGKLVSTSNMPVKGSRSINNKGSISKMTIVSSKGKGEGFMSSHKD